jgi:hypothetical protein
VVAFKPSQKSHEIGIPGKLERRSAGLKDTPWCFGELNDVFRKFQEIAGATPKFKKTLCSFGTNYS